MSIEMERKLLKLSEFKQEIIFAVKDKKELRALDEEFIDRKMKEFFSDHRNYQYKEKVLEKISQSNTFRQFSKSKECTFLIKNLRAELRKVYGAFILKEYEKKNKILKKLDDENDNNIHIELLKLHKSTNERLNHYDELYNKIFSGINKKIVVLDLACGLNPISNIFFRDKIKKYYASDISSEDCDFLKEYFKKINIENEIFPMDLTDTKNYKKLSLIKCDVCFIFKTLDGLERVERNISEKLFKSITAPLLAVTFPTLTLSGHREIKEYRRVWLEKLLDKLEWKWEKKLIENELLYLIRK